MPGGPLDREEDAERPPAPYQAAGITLYIILALFLFRVR
jgi:hypothetical protein